MPCFLMLLWLITTVIQWAFAFRGLRELSGESDSARRAAGIWVVLLAAVPPSLIFLVSAFVLLQAAPTVQFNAGSSFALSLWSFWVHWWPTLFGCSGVQAVCYGLWTVASFATKHRPWMRMVVLCGFISSLWGWLLLRMAYPTA